MNSFEFLPLIAVGQYFPTGSLLHRMDARAKLVVFAGLILAATFTPSFYGLVVALAVVMIGLLLSRVSMKAAFKGLKAPLPFLFFIVVIQLLFFSAKTDPHMYFSWQFIHIGLSGVLAAGMLFLRFIVLILAISLSSFCLSTSEIITGLDHLLSPLRHLGIKTMDLVMVVQVTLRFLPLLAISAERIAKAQASRGAEWGTRRGGIMRKVKQVFPLIVPLILISLRRSESMALAMDVRGYGLKDQRTSLYGLVFSGKDILLLGIGLILVLLIFLV